MKNETSDIAEQMFITGTPKLSGVRLDSYMTERGLVVVIRDPDQLHLASHWALNGSGVTLSLALKEAL